MRLLLVALFCVSGLFSAALLNYEFYPRNDRFDIMVTFSKSFEGEIKRQTAQNSITVTLSNASIYENVKKSFDNKLVSDVRIYQEGQDLNIVFTTNTKLNLTASKTSQGMGLRLRLKEDAATKNEEPQTLPQTKESGTVQTATQESRTQNSAEFKNDNVDMMRYLAALVVLLILVGAMLYVKRKMGASTSKNWLFNSLTAKSSEVRIVSQKQLDIKNRVVIFEVGSKQYTVLMGQSGYLLLDKTEPAKKRGSGFDAILGENEERLNSFLELENRRLDDIKLENYKRKAGTLYEE